MKAFKVFGLVLVIVASVAYSTHLVLMGPCNLPRKYRIGSLDDRFGISREDFLSAVKEAESLWEAAIGRDLFTYDDRGAIPVSLRYDDRQALSDRNKAIESHIDSTEKSAESIKREFESLKRRYEATLRDYQELKSLFEERQKDYNERIAYWNSRDGAPKAEFQALQNEKAALENAYRSLEAKRLEVNDLASEINAQVKKYNYLVDVVNDDIAVVNQSADKEFEQGEYVRDGRSEKIDIYEFKSRTNLVRVLAHEFGHALDSDHNDNPDSIMYYLNSSPNMKPTAEDIAGIKASCKI